MTNQVFAPAVRTNVHGKVSLETVADVLTYTAPTNKRAEVGSYFAQRIPATVTLFARIRNGADDYTLGSASSASLREPQLAVQLEPGESFVIRVTATSAVAPPNSDLYAAIFQEA